MNQFAGFNLHIGKMSFLRLVKGCIKSMFLRRYELDAEPEDDVKIIFLISQPRYDYMEFFEAVRNSCEISKSPVMKVRNVKKFNLRVIKFMLKNFKFINQLENFLNRTGRFKITEDNKLNLLHKIHLLASYAQIVEFVNYIHDKKLFGAKYLMMLCDMWPVETFLSEYLRFENITLIYGQHAIFQPLNENDYINNISGVFRNNRNCNDKYLTWGGGTIFRVYARIIN